MLGISKWDTKEILHLLQILGDVVYEKYEYYYYFKVFMWKSLTKDIA